MDALTQDGCHGWTRSQQFPVTQIGLEKTGMALPISCLERVTFARDLVHRPNPTCTSLQAGSSGIADKTT